MPTQDQKRIWKEEREQQLRDKASQGRVVKRHAVDLKFGGIKKKKQTASAQTRNEGIKTLPDDILRKRLGL